MRTLVLVSDCRIDVRNPVLADSSPSRIVAIDNHPPLIDALIGEAQRLDLSDRMEAQVGIIRGFDFGDRLFD